MATPAEKVLFDEGREGDWIGIYDDLDFEIHDDLDFETYASAPGINNSGLKEFRRSPAHYLEAKEHPKPDTHEKRVGHAFHCLALEPSKFDELYVKSEYKEFRSNEAKEWKAEMEKQGKTVIGIKPGADPHHNPSEWDLINRMRDAVLSHPDASILLKGVFERSMWWRDKKTGLLCKGRMDIWNDAHRIITDLKTAADASYSAFSRAVDKFGYFRQDPFYTDGAAACELDPKAFVFVVVEKNPPYGVACYELDDEWRRQGQIILERDLAEFKRAKEADYWPGYSPDKSVRTLHMPGYAKHHPIY